LLAELWDEVLELRAFGRRRPTKSLRWTRRGTRCPATNRWTVSWIGFSDSLVAEQQSRPRRLLVVRSGRLKLRRRRAPCTDKQQSVRRVWLPSDTADPLALFHPHHSMLKLASG
jgi:hypothetical protein